MSTTEFLDWMTIDLHKREESPTSRIYTFTTTKYLIESDQDTEAAGPVSGALQLTKSNGEVALLEAMPGDDEKRIETRAARQLLQHWEKGELPDSIAYRAG